VIAEGFTILYGISYHFNETPVY